MTFGESLIEAPRVVEVSSYPVSIFMAGDIERAKVFCQEYVDQQPWCVTITATDYIHPGVRDAGFVVGLIHYPRFPTEPAVIWAKAEDIAAYLRRRLGQQSYTIQAPDKTVWFSHREADA